MTPQSETHTGSAACPTCEALDFWFEFREWNEKWNDLWDATPAANADDPPGADEMRARRPKAPQPWLDATTQYDLRHFLAATPGMLCVHHDLNNPADVRKFREMAEDARVRYG